MFHTAIKTYQTVPLKAVMAIIIINFRGKQLQFIFVQRILVELKSYARLIL